MFPGLNRVESVKKLVHAYNADPGRALQHSFCYDLRRNWSVSVSWGYTVQLYPKLVTAKLLETVFRTFVSWRSWSKEPFTFNTRGMSSDPCEQPVMYFLDRVEDNEMGETLTTYDRTLANQGNKCNRQEYEPALAIRYVNVSAAKSDVDMWKKVRNLSFITYELHYFKFQPIRKIILKPASILNCCFYNVKNYLSNINLTNYNDILVLVRT